MGIFGNIFKRESANNKMPNVSGANMRGRVVYAGKVDKALKIAAFRHGINLRAQTAARAVLKFERKRPDGRWEEFSKGCVEYRHLNRLLQVRPNRFQTASQMWKQAYKMRDLQGHAGIYMKKVMGQVDELIPVSIMWQMNKDTCTVTNEDLGLTWDNIPVDDVIILKGEVRSGYPLGRSLVWLLEDNLTSIATTNAMCLDVMSKGGTFRAIVRQEVGPDPLSGLAALDNKQMEEHTDKISQQFNEGNYFIYDDSAAQITPITQSFQDLQVSLQKSSDIEDIARGLDVPLPLMFCSTNAVYKSVDDAWQTFKTLTIEPILEEVEQELNAKLLSEEDWDKFRFKFHVDHLCLDTHKSKAETSSIYVTAGIKTTNEVREEMGMPPKIEEGGEGE